ncbi:MAG: hypothetical protein JW861_12095 [Bacteroidales bacterium]|nr:hypothetical protein [Bacteroidales bacterium]
MKKITLSLAALVMAGMFPVSGQNIILTFNGDNNGLPVAMDSIRIRNLSKGVDTMLFYPDNALYLILTGTNDQAMPDNGFRVFQNHPNPMDGESHIDFIIPEKGEVTVGMHDAMGRCMARYNECLEPGSHSLCIVPGREQLYLLTLSWSGHTQTIKMLNPGPDDGPCRIDYLGSTEVIPASKSGQYGFLEQYEPGDHLLYIGYNSLGQSGLQDDPEESREYTVQFATNVPCPGNETVTYEGQIYNTIQVFGQCWFKENLNAGTMLPSSQAPTNNGAIEKYCQLNDPYLCNMLGGLYFWAEMMNYSYTTGGRGICPEGWHIPCDLDWKILEGAVDSQYKIGDTAWNISGWRGTDAGGNLKQTGTSLWEPPNTGATDAFGFTALPGGYFVQGGFWGAGWKAYFWSSEVTGMYFRNMDWNQMMIKKGEGGPEIAISVRCIKNN